MSNVDSAYPRPRITLKIAQTLDGRVASASGDSRWITGIEARRVAHELRSQHRAVLVGIGTVLTDDPELTVRHQKGPNPVRVVIDSTLRIPLSSTVLRVSGTSTIVISTSASSARKRAEVEQLGAKVLIVPSEGPRVALPAAFAALSREDIDSVLVEGGPTVATALLQARMVDRLVVFIAPKILGNGVDAVGELHSPTVERAISLENVVWSTAGRDMILDGTPAWPQAGDIEESPRS